jgi:hypothetical protein
MDSLIFDNSGLVAFLAKPDLVRSVTELVSKNSLRILTSPILFEETLGGLFGNTDQIASSRSCINFLKEFSHQRLLANAREVHIRAGKQALGSAGRMNIFDSSMDTPITVLFDCLERFPPTEKEEANNESIRSRRVETRNLMDWLNGFQEALQGSKSFRRELFQKPFREFSELHLEGQYQGWNPVPGKWRARQIQKFFNSNIPTLRVIPLFILYQLWARNQRKPPRRKMDMNDIRQLVYFPSIDYFISEDDGLVQVARLALEPMPEIASRVLMVDEFERAIGSTSWPKLRNGIPELQTWALTES